MEITLDIARASMSLSEFRFQHAIDIAMLKKTMEMQELQAEYLISKLPEVAPPSGSIIDVKA